MKRKILNVLLALVLVLSFSLVTAAVSAVMITAVPATPAVATAFPATLNVIPFSLATTASGVAAWTSTQHHSGSSSANLTAPATADYARVKLALSTAFSSFAAPSFYYKIGAGAIATTENITATWPMYDRSGQTVSTGYLSPYPVIYITDGATPHYIIGQPWAESTKVDWTLWNNATASNVTTQALWHMEDFSVNPGIGGSVPADWGPLSFWETHYTGYTVVGIGVGLGSFAVTGQQQAYVDDVTAGGTTYNLEGASTDYGTIQAAIDAASTGDTINVTAGMYSEGTIGVHTVADLTIQSVSGAATTIISGPPGTNKLFEIGGATGDTADGFTLDGFTLSGTYEYGVYMYIRGFDIENNIIYHPNSDGIFATNPTTGPPVDINSGTINNNVITGRGEDAMAYRPGILLESNDAVGATIHGITISNNTVSGFGTTTFGEEAAGIRCASVVGSGVVSDITITGNTLTGNRIGLHIYGSCTGLVIHDNTMSANQDGVVVCNSSSANISSTFDLYENTITNNTVHGVYFKQTGEESITGTKTIRYNDISGNGAGMLSDFTTGTDPVAKYNWWGDRSGPAYNTTDITGNDRGTGDTVSAHITFQPWLTVPYATAYGSGIEYSGYNLCVLVPGWNIWSTPIALDTHCDTWGEYRQLGTDLDLAAGANAYYFNATTQTWASVTDAYALTPCDAIYINMADTQTSPILFSPTLTAPSKALKTGWNLVSASYIDYIYDPDIYNGVAADTALASVYYVTGDNEIGYSQVVSPATGGQEPWTFVRGDDIESRHTDEIMYPTKGYWVFMTNPGTLAGTVFTPITTYGPA